jgi:uncharacterized protein (DUF1501 family)
MQHHHFNIMNRRSFLSAAGKAGMAAALASVTNVPGVLKRAMAEGTIGSGRKVLFIWLRGANDSLNSVIPVLDPAYATSRPQIRIPMDAATDYSVAGGCDNPQAGSASTYGSYPFAIRLGNSFAALHPSLKFLAPVYNAGDLALIHRVGYPKQSRSHFDSQIYWENGSPNNSVSKDGIFYRTIIESGLAGSGVTGVSIQNSLPLILRGPAAAMTNLTDPLRYDLFGVPSSSSPGSDSKATNALAQANSFGFAPKQNRDLLFNQYLSLQQTLKEFAAINFTEAGNTYRDDDITDNDTAWATAWGGGYYLFPTTNDKNGGWRRTPGGAADGNKYVVNPSHQSFFYSLRAAALVLNHTSAIIAGTELGGFDTHDTQVQVANQVATATLGNHADLQRVIGWSLYALRKYFLLNSNQASWDNLVVVTLSEFGRTSRQNDGFGTDHAEAGAMFVAGGAVKGYNQGNPSGVFNCSPGEAIPWVTGPAGSMFGVSSSYLKRTTDYRSVLGEVIRKHLGATQAQLNRILPGYANESQEHLLGGGTVMAPIESSSVTTQIRGEVGIL